MDPPPHPGHVGALLGLEVLRPAVAPLLFFRILAVATNVMLVHFLVPVSAMLLGRSDLGGRLGWTVFAGMALVFTGLATTDGWLLDVALGRRAADDTERNQGGSTA